MSKAIFPRMHVSLYVKSVVETEKFYNKFFNESPAKIKDDYLKYELDEPALTISFIQSNKEITSNFGHLGIQIKTKSELNEQLIFARANKLLVEEEMNVACCHAFQDKFWVTDPDGYDWEVYHFIDDMKNNDVPSSLKKECC